MSKQDDLAARRELERVYAELEIANRCDSGLAYSLDDHLRIARLLVRQRREHLGAEVHLEAGLLARALGTPTAYGEAIVAFISND